MFLPLTMLACGPVTLEDPSPDPLDTGVTETATDTATPPTDTGPERVGEAGHPIFGMDVVHSLDITLSDEAIRSLDRDPWDYVEGAVVFDGKAVDSVGVRLKGAWGSFEDLDGKANFKIDFNRYVDGQDLWGTEQLTVNNSRVDCSFLREVTAYHVIDTVGLHETRTGFVWVTVNGTDYGLYVLVETPDDEWLDHTFEASDGNLYDGKYIFTEDWDFVSYVDFTPSEQVYFELEEGTDVGLVDVEAVTEVLRTARSDPDGYEHLGQLVDWSQLQRVWATEQWVGQLDGYWLNTNNYRIYFNPLSQRMEMLPWDMDYSFYNDSDWGMDWWRPSGELTKFCMQDADCLADLRTESEQVLAILDATDLDDWVNEVRDLIEPHANADTRACTSDNTIYWMQEEIETWVRNRSDEVREIWEE